MQISITFPSQPETKHSLQVLKKIGQGKFSVYQVYCPSQRKTYALKAFPKDSFGATQYQKENLLTKLSHPNIIQSIDANIVGAEEVAFYAAMTEFAQYGDFFEMVVAGVFNSEILIRTYFHQLLAGIEYMHSQKVAHLDLKLENLMMGSDYTLKIIDFDQAQPSTDKKVTSGGTKGFRAPEVIEGRCKDLRAADLYSAGIILYALRAQEYPFAEIQGEKVTLKYYSSFTKNNKAFWDMKSAQKRDESFFSESFKQIINGMLDSDVIDRFTIEDIKKSQWYNGPILEGQALKSEMKARYDNFKSAKKN